MENHKLSSIEDILKVIQRYKEKEFISFIYDGLVVSKSNEKRKNRSKSIKIQRFERNFKWIAKQAMYNARLKPSSKTLFIIIKFVFKNKIRLDLTNCDKSVCDAMNGIVYDDDRQIELTLQSIEYDKERPRIEVIVMEMKDKYMINKRKRVLLGGVGL